MDNREKEVDLYREFLKYSYKELQQFFLNSKSIEEQEFYITLINLILKRDEKVEIKNY